MEKARVTSPHTLLIVGGTAEQRRDYALNYIKDFNLSPPDILTLKPEEERVTISINQARELKHWLFRKPFSSKLKVALIFKAQNLTPEAQNALLKTLEEPPNHSLLILATSHPGNLLSTIVSRCQILDLGPALDLDLKSKIHKEAVYNFSTLLRQGRGERLCWAESNKEDIKHQASSIRLLASWISVLRDLLLIKEGCKSWVLNKGISAPDIPKRELLLAISEARETRHLLETTNVNPRLALEVFLLNLPVVE